VRTVHEERLWPAGWVWAGGALVALTLGVVFVPATSVPVAVAVGALALLGVAALLRSWSPVVRVVEPVPGEGLWLEAGGARIPLAALGPARALDAEGMRHELGPGLDARSYRCIRGWVATGVRVAVEDVRDPVPYWLVSTREPDRLAAALERPATGPRGER
jgi:hypothetical protein